MARYRKRPTIVEAIRMRYQGMLQTPLGGIGFEVGDWLVTEENGYQHLCKEEHFDAMYEEIPAPGRKRKGSLESPAEEINLALNKEYSEPAPFFRGEPKDSQAVTTEPHDGYPMEVKI